MRNVYRRAWTPNLAAIAALCAAAAASAAMSLTTLNTIKDAAVATSLAGRPISLPALLHSIGLADVALGSVALTAALLLVAMEWRRRAFTRLLTTATGREAFACLTIVLAWCGHAYLSPGVLLGGDTATHISRFLEVARGLDAGELPVWTNYQYGGASLLYFTGPLTYVVGGALAFMLRDAVLAAKALLFALHMLGGWAFFAFLRRLAIRPIPAMLAAAGFGCAFAHLHLFLYRGVFPQAFTLVFVVLLFHCADGLLREQGARWANATVFALATAGLILNHQPHALFAAFYLAVFGFVALVSGFWRWHGLPLLCLAGALGVMASVVAVLPTVAEAGWVMLEPDGALFGLHLPTARRLLNLVLWRDTRTTWGIDYWAYLGLGLIVFGAAGIAALARGVLPPDRRRLALAASACLALCFVLYNPVVRDIQFMLFFLGVLAAVGMEDLLARPALAGRRLLIAALVVLVDLASTSVQPVARTDKGFLLDAGRMLERTAPDQRVVELGVAADGSLDADMGPDGSPVSYDATVQRIAGNHNMAATRLHNFLAATAKMVQADLQGPGVLSPVARTLLAVFNVGRVICHTPVANGCPARIRDTAQDPVLGRYLRIGEATPAVFSPYLVALELPPGVDKPMLWPDDFPPGGDAARVGAVNAVLAAFVDAEALDLTARTARGIAVRDSPEPPSARAPGPERFAVRAYAVTLDRVRLRIEAAVAGYVQLAHPWSPSTIVTVNGAEVRARPSTIGLMVLPVQAGVSTLTLTEGTTIARTGSLTISALGIAAILLMAVLLARRDRIQAKTAHA